VSRPSIGWLVLLIAAIVRLLVAAVVPLYPDEAFYWEWSRRLAAGYSEHPAMVALFIRAGTALFGDTPLGVRLLMVFCGAGAAWAAMQAARAVADAHAGDVAAILVTAIPVLSSAFLLATPDAPLLMFVALTLMCVARALTATAGPRALHWWLGAGLAAGLAMTSKYTAVLIPVGVAFAIGGTSSLRSALRTAGPYVATLVASLIMLPTLRWNAAHGWVSFQAQIAHGLGQSPGSAWRRELELLGGQVLLASPILFALAAAAMLRALRADGRLARLLAVVALLIACFFAFAATRSRVEANWPAPAWVAAAVLLAIVPFNATWRKWRFRGVLLGFVFSAATYLQAVARIVPLPPRLDPTAKAYGWDDLATAVSRGSTGTPEHRWVAADRYQDAAELAFLLPGHPDVFFVNLTSRSNQYFLWPGFPERARVGDDLMLVLHEHSSGRLDPVLAGLSPLFGSVERGELVTMRRGEKPIGTRRLWLLRSWRGAWLRSPQ
jgi:4-amino-4-deoxy-L-arabinose transferase-like glycosyltransferase